MGPTDYLRTLERRWKILVACVLVALTVGWVFTRDAQTAAPARSYRATTHLISSSALSNLSAAYRAATNLQTVAALVTLGDVPARVAQRLGSGADPAELTQAVAATADPTTGLLTIAATAPSARRAELLADTFAEELLASLRERNTEILSSLEERLDDLDQEISRLDRRIERADGAALRSLTSEREALELQRTSVTQQHSQLVAAAGGNASGFEVVEPAMATPVATDLGFVAPRSRTVRLLLVGVVGLLLGVVVALLLERFDSRIRSREDAEEAFKLPVLSEVPVIPRRRRRSVVAGAFPHAPATESYGLLAASIQFGQRAHIAGRDTESRTILVTSPAPLEGKSTTVANLAATFAEIGKRVVVLCCDFRHPTLHSTFEVHPSPGLSEALLADHPVELSSLLQATRFERVFVLSTGRTPDNISGLFGSDGMRALLKAARAIADVVLIDTAPVLAASDWTQLLPEAETVILVARAGKTDARSAARTMEILSILQAPIHGVVLNRIPRSLIARQGSGYGGYGRPRDAEPAGAGSGPTPHSAEVESVGEVIAVDGRRASSDGGNAPSGASVPEGLRRTGR